MELQGKVAVVTGGATGMGKATALALAAKGARIVIMALPALEAEAKQVAAQCGEAAVSLGDVTSDADCRAAAALAESRFGRLDALVNNASSFYPTAVGDITEKAWDDLMGTNLKAPLFLAQAAARELRKTHGCIVNIIDIHAEVPMKNHLVYNAAKGGLLTLTRSLARELGPEVRVNGIAPGTILWPENDTWQDEVARQRIINQTALKRIGEPDDIAKAVEFLIAQAPYVTGQVIAVDGGRSVNL